LFGIITVKIETAPRTELSARVIGVLVGYASTVSQHIEWDMGVARSNEFAGSVSSEEVLN
jgi:hypothetical protein